MAISPRHLKVEGDIYLSTKEDVKQTFELITIEHDANFSPRFE